MNRPRSCPWRNGISCIEPPDRPYAKRADRVQCLCSCRAATVRTLGVPEPVADWSLTSLLITLIRIGARAVWHARAITCQLAEVAVSGRMVRAVMATIQRLRAPAPLVAVVTRSDGHAKAASRQKALSPVHPDDTITLIQEHLGETG